MKIYKSKRLEKIILIIFLIIQFIHFYLLTFGSLYHTIGSPFGFLIIMFFYSGISELILLIIKQLYFIGSTKDNKYRDCFNEQVTKIYISLIGGLVYFLIIYISVKYQVNLINLTNQTISEKARDISELSGWYYAVSNWVNLSFAFFLGFRILGINLNYLLCKVRNYFAR